MDPILPLMIESDPAKSWRLLLLSLAFVAAGAFMAATAPGLQAIAIGMAGVAFFGALALVLISRIIWPPRLVVTEDGLAWSGKLRSWTVPWRDVQRFRLRQERRSASVLIDYRDGGRPRRSWFRGRPGGIADVLRVPSRDLAPLLNRLAADRRGIGYDGLVPAEVEDKGVPLTWRTFPWVTTGLVISLALVFAAEVRAPVTPADGALQPSTSTLVAYGGLSRSLLLDRGEWFRLVTAPFLHGNLRHVLFNALALVWAGWLLERLVGRWWFAAVYASGALGGGLVSASLDPPNIVGVGASGAIMALFAATFVLSFHYPGSAARSRLQAGSLRVLIPTLVNVGGTAGILKVDVWAHAGGTLAGGVIGLVLLRLWAPRTPRPAGQRWVRVAVLLAAGLAAAAVRPAVVSYEDAADYVGASGAFAAGDLDGALAAVRAYVARSPAVADGWSLQGDILFARGDVEGALAAYDRTYALDASPVVLRTRGLTRFYAGDGAGAVADLQKAVAGDGIDLYAPIWLDILRERQGLAASLTPATVDDGDGDWPKPVQRLFAGLITPDRLAATASPSRTPSSDQGCEAGFYAAELSRIKGRRDEAEAGFREARQTCPPTFIESWMARAELDHGGD